jgi:hypothetical protein
VDQDATREARCRSTRATLPFLLALVFPLMWGNPPVGAEYDSAK